MLEDDRLYRQFLRQRFALLHLKKNRRLLQPAAQIHRHQAKYAPQQEGDPPAAVVDPLRRQAGVDKRRHHRSQQDAYGQAGRQRAAGDTNAFFRNMLGDKHPGARHLAADRRPLQNTHQQQQQRRDDTHRAVGRQQTNRQGRHRHQQNAEGKHFLTPYQIAKVGHDDPPQRTRQVTGGENAKGLYLAQPFRNIRGEEELADDGGEENEDDKVIKLQRAAKGGQR